jgi:uncharacterized protein YdbL (DUF1318 family)
MKRFSTIIVSVLVVMFGLGTVAFAQTKADLRQRFRERLKDLNRLKADGLAGETHDGWIAAVKGKDLNKKEQRIVDDENDDRRALYRIIADDEKTTAELVGTRNGTRNRKNLKVGEWFKTKDGDWEQKKRSEQ